MQVKKISLIYQSVLQLLFVNLVFGFSLSFTFAEPRLAVLELQGDVGSVTQKQAWSDTMRAAAINIVKDHGIQVIDRDQFTQLIDPNRDLSDCVGLCAAEVAREIGAHWSLSSMLIKDDKKYLLTMKIHDVSGQLLDVKQEKGTLSHLTQKALITVTEQVLESALFEEVLEEQEEVQNKEQKDSSQPQEKAQIDETEVLEPDWYLVKTDQGAFCMSALVSKTQYTDCIRAGECTASAQWGNCQIGGNQSSIRCINVQQALQYAKWSKSWLPSYGEWTRWQQKHHYSSRFYEWVIPSQQKTPRSAAQWRNEYLELTTRQLKVAKSIEVLQTTKTGMMNKRRTPPNFQTSDLSFRVVSNDLARCSQTR
jgi:hypothetical protein